METQSVYFNVNVCDSIITNTFEFNDFFNRFVYKYINTVSILAHCMNSEEILEAKEAEVEDEEDKEEKEKHKEEEEEDEEKKRLEQELKDAEEEAQAAREVPKNRILENQHISKIPGFENGIPDELLTTAEKMEIKPQTIQEKLREEKQIEEELKKEAEALEPSVENEENIPEEEEKSMEDFEMEIIQEFIKQGNQSKGFHFSNPEKKNSMDFLEIDNDYFNEDCKIALKSGKMNKIRERCITYCHKYNLWFFTDSVYRDIRVLERMFNFIKKFLIDDLEYDAEGIPDDIELDERKIFRPKKKVLDVFGNFNYYFGAEGIHKNALFEFET